MSNDERTALEKELAGLKAGGVYLSVEGKEVEPGEQLVDLLLAESGYTYMRNYKFRDGKVVGIEFDKISLTDKL
ncbi:MAG: hypothetical protein ACI4EW_09540 [Butyrivibrio sp.]